MHEFSEHQARMEMPDNQGINFDIRAVAVSSIEDASVIEVEPMKHRRWIVTEQENSCAIWTDFKCPVCGAVFDGNEWLFDKWKGCPVCLTRLDGE